MNILARITHQEKIPLRLCLASIMGLSLAIISNKPLKAQTPVPDNSTMRLENLSASKQENFLEDIEFQEEVNWSFSSETESLSVRDEITELQEYSASDSEELDVDLEAEDNRWGNRGDVEDYSVEVEVYDY